MKKAIVAVILIAVAATVFVMAAGCEDSIRPIRSIGFPKIRTSLFRIPKKIRISTMPEAIGILLPPRR